MYLIDYHTCLVCVLFCYCNKTAWLYTTVNVERFAGLDFREFKHNKVFTGKLA